MPLPTNLISNEVKDSSGVEVEYNQISQEGSSRTFRAAGGYLNRPKILKVSHMFIGSGSDERRRSLVRFAHTISDGANSAIARMLTAQLVLDIPIGGMQNLGEAYYIMANMNSFLSTTGAATTVLFDGSGYGTKAAVEGTL